MKVLEAISILALEGEVEGRNVVLSHKTCSQLSKVNAFAHSVMKITMKKLEGGGGRARDYEEGGSRIPIVIVRKLAS